jgi:two-component system, chemotaxis family, CheB/CheR fusion protein
VYVIPPNTELSVVDGLLHLARPAEPRGMRLPINVLFSSLASAQGERAIGRGALRHGLDGTLGLQAIKAVGGLTVAQQPDTAQFDSMPRSAIAAGCADIVAPPASCRPHPGLHRPGVRIRQAADAREGADGPAAGVGRPAADLEAILLQQQDPARLLALQASTLHRRIERRMAIHELDSWRSTRSSWSTTRRRSTCCSRNC